MPQELGTPEQLGAVPVFPAGPAVEAAKVENFLDNFSEPQCRHFAPCQSRERTRISLSFSHLPQ